MRADIGGRGAALPPDGRVSLQTIAREWGRIGVTGFGGPPVHISLLRDLCVRDRLWLSEREFEDGIAATNLLPGPASTQLSIFCAWRLRGWIGAIVGGVCFIVPGLVVILALSALFLEANPPLSMRGVAAGMGAIVPIVALNASRSLVPGSWRRAGPAADARARWVTSLAAGCAAAAIVGSYLVLILLACGLLEVSVQSLRSPARKGLGALPVLAGSISLGTLPSVAWVALKVGLLSYGGGFVIVPLMQRDAVSTHHWMTAAQFLNAVALGQVTPGPVVQTVAVVGYAAGGLGAGLLAALVAFTPSFLFVIGGGRHFDSLRQSVRAQHFLTGAGAAAIGGIGGAAIPLGLSLHEAWQLIPMGLAAIWFFMLRRGVVPAFTGAAALGLAGAVVGLPLAH